MKIKHGITKEIIEDEGLEPACYPFSELGWNFKSQADGGKLTLYNVSWEEVKEEVWVEDFDAQVLGLQLSPTITDFSIPAGWRLRKVNRPALPDGWYREFMGNPGSITQYIEKYMRPCLIIERKES